MRVVESEEVTRHVLASAASVTEFGGCVMCAIAAGSHDAGLVVTRTGDAIVVLDRFAASRGHLLVILAAHEEHVSRLSWPAWQSLQRLAWEASGALERLLHPRRIFVAALGSQAPIAKSFPHLHLHVVPLYEDGDAARPSRVFSWTHGICVYEEDEARELVAQLRDAWPISLPG